MAAYEACFIGYGRVCVENVGGEKGRIFVAGNVVCRHVLIDDNNVDV